MGIAGMLWIFVEPRAPISTAMRATVSSSAASMTVTKSYGPSTAHWSMMRAPIASTCALTCCRRLGFFFRDSTPSPDRVERRMNVGMAAKPTAARRARCRPARCAASASSSSSSGASCDGCPRRSSAQASSASASQPFFGSSGPCT